MDGYPQYPAQPGTQYPQGYGQPGTQYPQQPYAQRAAPPPERGGRGWIAAVVLGIVAITIAGGLVAGWLGYRAYRQAQTRDRAAAAEAHMARLPSRLTAVRQKLAGVRFDQTDVTNKTVEAARNELDAIGQELASARSDVLRIDDPALAAAYADSVSQAAFAVKAGRTLAQTAQTLNMLEQRTAEGVKLINEGTALVDQSINLGNKGKYSDQVAKAVAADTKYSAAQQLFEDAARVDPKCGAGGSAGWTAKAHQLTSLLRLQGIDGVQGHIDAYNKKVPQVNRMAAELNALKLPPVIDDPHYGDDRVQKLANEMAAAASRASGALQEARSRLQREE